MDNDSGQISRRSVLGLIGVGTGAAVPSAATIVTGPGRIGCLPPFHMA